MSNSPDDQPGQGQGGGQHGGQPQGGQPAGGQPAGGQPAGGQPQGQYQGGQAQAGGYQTGPGIGDIMSIPETKNELKVGLAFSGLLTLGFVFASIGMKLATPSFGGGGFGAAFGSMSLLISAPIVAALVLGLVIGVRQADVLEDQPSNIKLGNAAVTTLVGAFILTLLSYILGALIIAGGVGGVGTVLLINIITAIGAAVVAAGTVWVDENMVPGPSTAQQPPQQQQHQQQPR